MRDPELRTAAGDRNKGNGKDTEETERKDKPWPDDSVPRPPVETPTEPPPPPPN